MRAARSLDVCRPAAVVVGCQLLESSPQGTPSTAGLTRMQGELGMANGKLVFKPCQGNTLYAVHDSGGTSVMQEAATLAGTQHRIRRSAWPGALGKSRGRPGVTRCPATVSPGTLHERLQ